MTRRDPSPAPTPAPDVAKALADLISEADCITILHGGVPGVSDRWAATGRARAALAHLRGERRA